MNAASLAPDAMLRRALLLLAPAITIVVAAEFIVVGLLPLVAGDFGLPLAKAGELTAWWALSAALAGPFITLAASRLPPRFILIATLLAFGVGNAVMAYGRDFDVLLIVRVIQGALLPAFISVSASVVARLAPANEQGRALAKANVGFVLGVLLALPAGIALAQGGDWRLPFLILALASLPMAALIAAYFPSIPCAAPISLASQLGLLYQSRFLGHLVLSVALFASMFAAYTYLGAWTEQSLGLSGWALAFLLFLFGMTGLAGNGIAGRFADRALLPATWVSIALLVIAINLAALAGGSILLAALPLAVWGIAHTASVALSSVRVTLAGKDAPAFAMTLNISAANLGIAVGALGGGWVVDRQGIGSIGLAPIGFAVAALVLAPLARGIAQLPGTLRKALT